MIQCIRLIKTFFSRVFVLTRLRPKYNYSTNIYIRYTYLNGEKWNKINLSRMLKYLEFIINSLNPISWLWYVVNRYVWVTYVWNLVLTVSWWRNFSVLHFYKGSLTDVKRRKMKDWYHQWVSISQIMFV